jgi:hypothetical protein
MAPKSDQLLIHSKTLQDISSTIVCDTAQLAANVQSFWQQTGATLDGEGGTGILLNHLPACLQAAFKNYEQQQQAELDKIVQERMRIGQLLSEASSLLDFQDQLSRLADIDIYKANTYYDGKNVPEHLLVPDSVKPSGT